MLVGSRKLAGILCESRRLVVGTDAVVIGVGINVLEQQDDFPAELHGRVTSFALEGKRTSREEVAAHRLDHRHVRQMSSPAVRFLNALEPLWTEIQEGDPGAALAAWKQRAAFWGQPVTVRSAAGVTSGIAHDLDQDGALVLRLDDGRQVTALAGDVEPAWSDGPPS